MVVTYCVFKEELSLNAKHSQVAVTYSRGEKNNSFCSCSTVRFGVSP